MSLFDLIEGSRRKMLNPSGGCHDCPRRKVDFVPATLHKTPLLWLGEAPGETETKTGEGFTGRSGELLRKGASEWAGLEPPYSMSNILHCRPPNNAAPKPKEIACCLSQYGMDEIKDFPVVVMCGNTPLQALFPGAKAGHFRGNVAWHPDFPGQRFYNIYHPAFILRRQDLKDEFRKQLERLGRIVRGEPAPAWKVWQGGSTLFWAVLEKALASPLISLDIETPCLESWNPLEQIRSLALTADGKDVIFAHRDEPHWMSVLAKVQAYLEDPAKAVVGNHIGFDLDWLEHELDFAVACTGIHDIAGLYYQAKQYKMPSLKELVANELDGYRFLIHNPGWETDLALLANYNAEDVVYPLHLFKKGMNAVKPKTRDLLIRVIGPSNLCLRQITSRGFHLREDYRQVKIDEYRERRRQVIGTWRDGDPHFIPDEMESGKGLHRYLFEIHKLPVVGRTETDAPSTDESAIRQWIAAGAAYLKPLLAMREIDKRLTTYLMGYDKHRDPWDGRIHSDYTQTLTDTGRASSRNPNLQNIPREPEIRDLFGVPDGWTLIEADLNQMEFRIMVCLAKDETGINGYLRGEDAHTLTARNFAKDPAKPTKEERSRAKPINFCVPMDTEILTRDGWKTYHTVQPGDETLGFVGGRMEWTRILGKTQQKDQPLVRLHNKWWEAVATPAHRWYGETCRDHGRQGHQWHEGFISTSEIGRYRDKLWLARPLRAPSRVPQITPAEAGVIGWLFTDGSVRWSPKTHRTAARRDGQRRGVVASIAQDHRKFAAEIRALLKEAGQPFREDRPKQNPSLRVFHLKATPARDLLRRAGLEDGTLVEFVRRLGHQQLARFVLAMRHAEGTAPGYRLLAQNDGPTREAMELALFFAGHYVISTPVATAVQGAPYFALGKWRTRRAATVTHYSVRASRANVTGQRLHQSAAGQANAWCVETACGTWTMRQRGRVMVTGNSLIYGGDWAVVQRSARNEFNLNWSEAECRGFTEMFFKTYPRLHTFHEASRLKLRANRGWFESVLGHVFHYDGWDDPDTGKREHIERAALNSEGQGPCAQMCFAIMVKARRLLDAQQMRTVRFVNTVHDSLLIEVPPDVNPGAVIAIMEEATASVYDWVKSWLVVPLLLEYKSGTSWGSLKDIKR